MNEDQRPEWPYKLSMKHLAMFDRSIKKIEHRWKFTSEDTAEDWVEFSGDKFKNVRMPDGFKELFEYKPDYWCLFGLTYQGEKAVKLSEEIEKFDKKHKRERAQYERLKRKFGGA